jgi:bifunctional ADP-heptose synthase (sugar kinase/adenylyltransferase)
MNRSRMQPLTLFLKSFHKSTVLVIEDVMQDEHIAGKASRIFPEAPIPIVEVEDRMLFPESLAAPLLRALTSLL